MSSIWSSQEISNEDRLVTELHQLGVTYLSAPAAKTAGPPHSPEQILAAIVRQPSARVRISVIALLLLHPHFAEAIPQALKFLSLEHQLSLKLFYTASVYLQRKHQTELQPLMASEWKWLPDLFSKELGLEANLTPQDAIVLLGLRHQELTHSFTNWAGTYENVVHHLIRYKQLELKWNQSLPTPSKNF